MIGQVLLLLGGLQGLILSLVIFSKRSGQPANIFLAGFVLILGLGCIFDNDLISLHTDTFVLIWAGNEFLIAPLWYLYVKRVSRQSKLSTRFVIQHMLAFLAIKTLVLVVHYFPFLHTEWVGMLGIALNVFLALLNVTYGLVTLVTLSKLKKEYNQEHLRWPVAMTFVFTAYSVILLLRRLFVEFSMLNLSYIENYLYVGVVVILYWISYLIINRPTILTTANRKYAKSGLSEIEITNWGEKISRCLKKDKDFISQDFNLAQLSSKIGIPKHQLSQVISQYFECSFYDLINEIRVNEVEQMLHLKAHENLSLTGIAFSCGFRSKSTFNNAFRKKNGVTPSQFLRTQKLL